MAAASAYRMVPSPLALALPPRSIAASLVRAGRRLAPAAADAVMCLCIANVWLFFAGLVAVGIGRVAGNEDCLMVEAASKVVSFCDFYLLHAFFIGMQLLGKRVDRYEPDEEKGPMSRRLTAALNELYCKLMPGVYACVPFLVLMVAGEVLRACTTVEGSREEALGSVIFAVGALGKNVLGCFIITPTVGLKMWRVTRPGWQRSSTIES
ncbi:hypothetical protein EJB05_49074 [Eragrostis curvula]|uniref:Uncharacterized protein n=1 Tax=Eragrostis curvula TaxID=38414 RepID=A0A5J9T3C9_9POAL|nr:hypothetical protein EJB05_49074 [Eragrostis curvula]